MYKGLAKNAGRLHLIESYGLPDWFNCGLPKVKEWYKFLLRLDLNPKRSKGLISQNGGQKTGEFSLGLKSFMILIASVVGEVETLSAPI